MLQLRLQFAQSAVSVCEQHWDLQMAVVERQQAFLTAETFGHLLPKHPAHRPIPQELCPNMAGHAHPDPDSRGARGAED